MSPDLQDSDYHNILFEINMNITLESFREIYREEKKKKETKITDELMHELGYTDEDILNNN